MAFVLIISQLKNEFNMSDKKKIVNCVVKTTVGHIIFDCKNYELTIDKDSKEY